MHEKLRYTVFKPFRHLFLSGSILRWNAMHFHLECLPWVEMQIINQINNLLMFLGEMGGKQVDQLINQ